MLAEVDAVSCKRSRSPSPSSMNRPTFGDPKTDFVFKRIFGSEQHKDVLVAFLNDMLGLDDAHRIVRVDLLSPEQRPAVAEMKLSIVDVKCTDARGANMACGKGSRRCAAPWASSSPMNGGASSRGWMFPRWRRCWHGSASTSAGPDGQPARCTRRRARCW
jgi:PD-(D/E)XK nuclease-like transposase